MRRLKILISAYACSPVRGSEPGMGWNFVKYISRYHDVWVIAEKEKFEKEVEEGLNHNSHLRKHITFYYISKKRHRTLRKIWPPSYYWFYKSWQKDAYQKACELDKEVNFDLVHQLNMVGFREPGYLWKMGKPFVWGPIGGMIQFPIRFLPCIGFKGGVFHIGRNVINFFQSRYSYRARKSAEKCNGALIAATSQMQSQILKLWGLPSHLVSEIGQADLILNEFSVRKNGMPLKLCWSGQHTPGKALPILLNALAMLDKKVFWELEILGLGPQTKFWQHLSQKLQIEKKCNWHGWVPKDKAMDIMRNSHVQIITSLKDLSSTVSLEALSQGVPIICLDHCGFADIVTPECGIKIPLSTPQKAISDFAHEIESLFYNEERRQLLAKNAIDRSNEFSWENKIKILNKIYYDVSK